MIPDPDVWTDKDSVIATIPVIEESITIEKRLVQKGGYRIDKQITEHEQVVDEALLAYDVSVERVAIGRLLPTMEAPASRQEGETLVIPVVEEVLVTEKRLMLKEELRVTRVQSTFRNPQTVSLRREEITVERFEP